MICPIIAYHPTPSSPQHPTHHPTVAPPAASELDKATVSTLEKSIKSSKIAKEFKSIKINNKVQPELLGGLVVDFGDDKTVDLSVKSRVQKLESLISRECRACIVQPTLSPSFRLSPLSLFPPASRSMLPPWLPGRFLTNESRAAAAQRRLADFCILSRYCKPPPHSSRIPAHRVPLISLSPSLQQNPHTL